MWFKEELDNCRALFENIEKIEIGDILDDDEGEVIGENPITLANLKNRILIPKTRRLGMTTVTFQRLWIDDLDFRQWLEDIGQNVLFGENTHVRIGFSFICWKPLTGEKIYIWAARSHATYNFFVDDHEEYTSEISKIPKHGGNLLHKTFIDQEEEDPFSNSGYCPLKFICSYIWIQK